MQIIDFVHITGKENKQEKENCALYRFNYIVDGMGTVCCNGVTAEVQKGDIFFLFPGVSYSITGNELFEYMYISYTGIRAKAEMEKRNINTTNFVFKNFCEIYPLWVLAKGYHRDDMELISKSLLLYALARISGGTENHEKMELQREPVASLQLIEQYVNENFTDHNLSVEQISSYFSYNKKYISTLFKKHYKVGLIEYINTLRINYACMLIARGNKSVMEIASQSGFNDPSYFAKVFRKKIGVSPSKYISYHNDSEVIGDRDGPV